ncbi:hypothetical protein EJ110_NYTH10411, partial [Nymphaea thermarum]
MIETRDFECLAGMKVNKQESEIFARTMIDCHMWEIQRILQWSSGDLPSGYLGHPLFLGSLTEDLCLSLLTKVEKRLAGWKARILSYGGRLCLIRYVLMTLPYYWMMAFRLSKSRMRSIGVFRRDLAVRVLRVVAASGSMSSPPRDPCRRLGFRAAASGSVPTSPRDLCQHRPGIRAATSEFVPSLPRDPCRHHHLGIHAAASGPMPSSPRDPCHHHRLGIRAAASGFAPPSSQFPPLLFLCFFAMADAVLLAVADVQGTGSNLKSENVPVHVTSIRLNKDNYLSWSAALEIGITSRGRLQYITGEKSAPAKNDPQWATWTLEDSQVKVWLISSVSADIQPLILRKSTAYE